MIRIETKSDSLEYFKRNGTPIVAVATALGGPVAIIRVSGTNLDFLKNCIGEFPPHSTASLRSLKDRNQKFLDEALILFFKGPKSFTGEDVIEIQSHGVSALIEKIISEIIFFGALPALPGEFSFRAVTNNKMTLDAASRLQSVFAQEGADSSFASRLLGTPASADEALQKIFNEALEDVSAARGRVEAAIDFSEAEHEQAEDIASAEERTLKLQKSLRQLLNSYDVFVSSSKQPRVVLFGRPNAGKSTLLNLMCGSERALVSSQAGTTRDYVEVLLKTRSGRPFRLVDTAGLWSSTRNDEIELAGMGLARELMRNAEILIWVRDSRELEKNFGDTEVDAILSQKNAISLWTHADLLDSGQNNDSPRFCLLGVRSHEVLDFVFEKIDSYFQRSETQALELDSELLVSQRQAAHLREAILLIEEVLDCLRGRHPLELVGDLLRNVEASLRRVRGEGVTDDYVGQIFTQFCLGK